MLIKWTEALSTDHEPLGQDHQRWVAIPNDFYQGFMGEKTFGIYRCHAKRNQQSLFQ